MGKNDRTQKHQYKLRHKFTHGEKLDQVPQMDEEPLDIPKDQECKKCSDAAKQRAKAEKFAEKRTGVRIKKHYFDVECPLCGNSQSSRWKKCRVCDTDMSEVK